MKNLRFLLIVVLFVGLFSIQKDSFGQATKETWTEYTHEWFCPCVGEYLVATLTSVGIINKAGERWRTKGVAIGYEYNGGPATGNVFEIKNVENYIFIPRDNGSFSPDKGVWTMQIRLNGKLVALTHPSYTIVYDSDGNVKDVIWSGFWCSPN